MLRELTEEEKLAYLPKWTAQADDMIVALDIFKKIGGQDPLLRVHESTGTKTVVLILGTLE